MCWTWRVIQVLNEDVLIVLKDEDAKDVEKWNKNVFKRFYEFVIVDLYKLLMEYQTKFYFQGIILV